MIGAAPIGGAPTTSELSTILLPAKVRLISDVWRYWQLKMGHMDQVYEPSQWETTLQCYVTSQA